MLLYFAMVISGIALLVWSADRFTDGSAAVARNFGIPPLIIGLTIVAMGSSAPEVVVSIDAARHGTVGLAVGNVIGSNIANIGMVLGIAAMVRPMAVNSKTLLRESAVLFAVMLFVFGLMYDHELDWWDGVLLLSGLAIYITWLTLSALKARNQNDLMYEEILEELPEKMPNWKAGMWIIIGLFLLQVSSRLLVTGASGIASQFGVSDFVIGVTIVAVGTSLPELAASVTSVLKGENELAIGNVIGSNIFNLLGVFGIPALITQIPITAEQMKFDYAFMFGMTIAVCIMTIGRKGQLGEVNRIEGGILFLFFVGYQAYQFASVI